MHVGSTADPMFLTVGVSKHKAAHLSYKYIVYKY